MDLAEIEAAGRGLCDVLVPTPLLRFGADGDELLLKPEALQVGGSFKIRGVFHAVAEMDPELRAGGISTVSAGNTAQALAWCGRSFGVPARSLMPDSAPRSKIEQVRALGGTPVLVPTDEVFRFLRRRGWEREPYGFVHPWTSREVMAGHGTLGLEILSECPDVATVFVPVGGGGLLGGVGSALKQRAPGVRVVAVEPRGCPALHASRAAGAPTRVACDTICDGVAVPYITDEMFPLLDEVADEVVLVPEDEVRAAVRLLATRARLVAEPSGALALAAALRRSTRERGRSVCLVTGGNVEPALLAEILSP